MTVKVVGSNAPEFASEQFRPSNAGYGQNQFGGPSSDVPGRRTASGFLPDPGAPVNDQLRKVSSEQYPTTFGNRNRNK